jgi:hypothetical protein
MEITQVNIRTANEHLVKVYIVSFRSNDDRPSKFIVLADNMQPPCPHQHFIHLQPHCRQT